MQKLGVDEITLRDLEAMPRSELLENLQRFAAFFPVSLNRSQLSSLSELDLRRLVNRARRKFQAMGY